MSEQRGKPVGLTVSRLGLGTWAMGGAAESWGQVDDRESIAAIHQALDLGINLIDTAPIYGLGHAEEIVGKAIQGRRAEVILATKCGLLFPRDLTEAPRRSLARKDILAECEQSLRRLRTDVIDIYQCHWPDPNTPIRETMDTLMALVEQEKIGCVGLSNFSCVEIAAAREYGSVRFIQAPFSMLHRRAADDLLPFCAEHDLALLAYSPLAKGLLTGKFRAADRPAGVRARDPDFRGDQYHRNLELVENLRPIAAGLGRTVAQLALNWVAGHPGVSGTLFGAKKASQVQENAGALGWSLSADDRHRIDHLLGGRSGGA